MFFYAADVTPVSAPLMQWAEIQPGASRSGAGKPPDLSRGSGALGEFEVGSLGNKLASTPGSELFRVLKIAPNRTSGTVYDSGISEAESIARERVVLLAAKYAASQSNKEIVARLEILNQRLLAQRPRVTEERVAALESIAAKLMAAQDARLKRKSLL